MPERELPGAEMEALCEQVLPFPNIKINNKRYKLFGVVTNLKWDGGRIIRWHRKRCGYSEQVHSEMKGITKTGGGFRLRGVAKYSDWYIIYILSEFPSVEVK